MMLRGVDRPKMSVTHMLVLIKDRYQLVAMVRKLGADFYYVIPIGFDVRFVVLLNDVLSEGRAFEVFL